MPKIYLATDGNLRPSANPMEAPFVAAVERVGAIVRRAQAFDLNKGYGFTDS